MTSTTESINQNHGDLKRLKAPLGVRLVAVYAGLGVLGTFPAGFALLAGEPTTVSIVMSSFIMLFGTLFLAIVYGLLKLKLWAYKLAKVVYSIVIVFGFIAIATNLAIQNIVQQGIAIAISSWIVIYLRKENIKSWFM